MDKRIGTTAFVGIAGVDGVTKELCYVIGLLNGARIFGRGGAHHTQKDILRVGAPAGETLLARAMAGEARIGNQILRSLRWRGIS